MRFLWLSIFTIMALSSAQTLAGSYDYKKYWSESKLKATGLTFSVLVKNSPISYLKYIASLTVTENNKTSIDTVLKIYKNSIDTKKWTVDNIDGLTFYETVDPKSSTLFRIAHNPKTNQYSVGAVKLRFLLPSYLEMHITQVERLTGRRSKTTAEFLYNLLILRAQAQSFRNFENFVPPILQQYGPGSSGDFSAVTSALTNLGTGLQSTGNGLQSTGAGLTLVGNNMPDLAASGRDIAASGHDVAGSIRGGTQELHGFREDIHNLTSDAKVGELAAVATLTSTVTAALTTFVLNGTWEMAKKAYREAMGEFSKEELDLRLGKFEKGMANFKELSEQMTENENKLTIFTQALSAATGNSSESILENLDKKIDKLAYITGNPEKYPQCNLDEIKKQLKNLIKTEEDLKPLISKAGKNASIQNICEMMEPIYAAWVADEYQLTMARKNIVDNFQIYMGVVNASTSDDEAFQEARKQKNYCIADLKSRISDIQDQADKLKCEASEENEEHPICMKYLALTNERTLCERAANVKTTEFLKGNLYKRAARMNNNIALTAEKLNHLDCSESKNDVCTKPGIIVENEKQIEKSISDINNKCPEQIFGKTFNPPPLVANQKIASSNPNQKEEGLLSRFIHWFTGRGSSDTSTADAQRQATQFIDDRLRGNG
jgi:hypothetical protein